MFLEVYLNRIARLLHGGRGSSNAIEATGRVSRLIVKEMIVNTFPSRTDNQIHALVDAQGRPLTAGQASDIASAAGLAKGLGSMLLADGGYDAEALLGPISLAPTVAQIGTPSTPSQFDLDNYVPFLFTMRTIFWSDLMDHFATLTAARKLFCRQSLTSSLLRNDCPQLPFARTA